MTPASALVSLQAMRVWQGELARFVNSEYKDPETVWIVATEEKGTVREGVRDRVRSSFGRLARLLRPSSVSGAGIQGPEHVEVGDIGP